MSPTCKATPHIPKTEPHSWQWCNLGLHRDDLALLISSPESDSQNLCLARESSSAVLEVRVKLLGLLLARLIHLLFGGVRQQNSTSRLGFRLGWSDDALLGSKLKT